MTSNHHASYVLGYKRATMAITKRAEAETRRKPGKDSLSSDCGLKLTHTKMKLLVIPNHHTKMKLLVIPNQNVGVNAFPGLVHTACHAMGVGGTQSR